MDNAVYAAGAAALLISMAALVIAVWRSSQMPVIESREEALAKRIEELETAVRLLQEMLLEKQGRIKELEKAVDQLQHSSPAQAKDPDGLVVVVGPDRMLEQDVARLRGIRSFHLSVLRNATMPDLADLLSERRARGVPVRYLHLAVHASHAGVQFADGLATGAWLSQNLKGVEVLVLAGCQGNRVANLLSVVPAVISMRDELDNVQAGQFALAFWSTVAEGRPVRDAYYYALEHSTDAVSEMAEFHNFASRS
jgi:hypothetical protein